MDGDNLSITTIVTTPAAGTAAAALNSGTVTVTGVAKGTTSVVVRVTDGTTTADVTVPITVANTGPAAKPAVPTTTVQKGTQDTFTAADVAQDIDSDDLTITGITGSPAPGTATASLNVGTVTVTGVAKGNTSVTVTVQDSAGASVNVEVPVVVANTDPAANQTIPATTVQKGTQDTFTAADLAGDGDGDDLTITAITASPSGSVATATLNSGTVTVTGVAKGSTNLTVTVTDGTGSIAVTVPVNVVNTNPAAKAAIPTVTVQKGTSDTFTASDVAQDIDGDDLTITGLAGSPALGTANASLNAGTVTITGTGKGATAVTVTVWDGTGSSNVEVPITVANTPAVPAEPVPAVTAPVNLTGSITAADIATDVDGDNLVIDRVTSYPSAARATVDLTGGTLTVTGVSVGSGTVGVVVTDGTAETSITVPISVVNTAPNAKVVVPTVVVKKTTSDVFDAWTIAQDANLDTITISQIVNQPNPAIASASLEAGTVTVTGVSRGSTTVVVRVSDGADTVDVTVPVTVANTAAAAKPTVPTTTVQKTTQASFTAAEIASDIDGDTLTISAITQPPAPGTATAALDQGTVTVTGVAKGATTVTVTVTDGTAQTDVEVPITVTNTGPAAAQQVPATTVQKTTTSQFAAADIAQDIDGDLLTITQIATGPDITHATAVLDNQTGLVTVTGVAKGNTTVTVTVSDGAASVNVTVPIYVDNTEPVQRAGLGTVALQAATPQTVRAADLATDIDGDTLTISQVVSPPDSAKATVTLKNGAVTLTPVAPGSTSLKVALTDGTDTIEVTVQVAVVNSAPLARDPMPVVSVQVGGYPAVITAASVAADSDGGQLTISGIATAPNPAYATASLMAGLVVIQGVAAGQTSVTVVVTDSDGAMGLATVPINVTSGANRAPAALNPGLRLELKPAGQASFGASNVASDPDGDALTITAVTSGPDSNIAGVSLANGTVTVAGVAAGVTSLTVSVSDGQASTSVVVAVEVTANPNTAPAAKQPLAAIQLTPGGAASFVASDVATDPDGDPLTVLGIAGMPAAQYATVALNSGVVTVTGVAAGQTAVSVLVSDGLASAVVVVPINVSGHANATPVALSPGLSLELAPGGEATVLAAQLATDPDGDPLAINSIATMPNGSYATAALGGGGVQVTGVALGSTGLAVTVTDGISPITVWVTITVTPAPNEPPTVIGGGGSGDGGDGGDDEPGGDDNGGGEPPAPGETPAGGSTTIGAGDLVVDPEGDPVSIIGIVTPPDSQCATAELVDGELVVTATGAPGCETEVTVVVSDGKGNVVVTVPVDVTAPPNNPPQALSSGLDIDLAPGGTARLTVAQLASDADGDTLATTSITVPPEGAVATAALDGGSGDLVITAVAAGTTSLTVGVTDGQDTANVEVLITVSATAPANQAPTPKAQVPEVAVLVGQAAQVTAAQVAEDTDGDVLSLVSVAGAPDTQYATASVAGGKLTVTGVAAGATSVSVVVSDGRATCVVAIPVTVTAPVNATPVALDPGLAVEVKAGGQAWFTAVNLATDPDGDTLAITGLTVQPAGGTATAAVGGGGVTVTGVAAGDTSLTVAVTDGIATIDVAVPVHVTGDPNGPPAARPGSHAVSLGTGDLLHVTAAQLATDPDGDPLTVIASATSPDPATASLEVNQGQADITGMGMGVTQAAVVVSDGKANVTVTIQITVTNGPPAANHHVDTATVGVRLQVVVTASQIATDPEDDPLVITQIVNQPNAQVATARTASGAVAITGVAPGSTTVTVTVSDGGQSTNVTVPITVFNNAPEPANPPYEVSVKAEVSSGFTAADLATDANQDTLAIEAITAHPAPGVANAVLSSGVVTVTGVAAGATELTVTVTDGLAAIDVDVPVTVANTAPTAKTPVPTVVATTYQVATFQAADVARDVDGQAIVINAIVTGPAGLVATTSLAAGVVTVTPVGVGVTSVVVNVTDGSDDAQVTVPVAVVNSAPVAAEPVPAVQVPSGGQVALDTGLIASDPDGDLLTIAALVATPAAANATAVLVDGQVTLHGIHAGSTSLTVVVTDPAGAMVQVQVPVTVAAVPNRAPTALVPPLQLQTKPGEAVSFRASHLATDPDGDSLSITAITQQPEAVTATATLADGLVTVTGVALGGTDVTVTVSDGHLSLQVMVHVTVTGTPNVPPAVSGDTGGSGDSDGTTAPVEVQPGGPVTLWGDDLVQDPEGGPVEIAGITGQPDPGCATATLVDGELVITGTGDDCSTEVVVVVTDGQATTTVTVPIEIGSPSNHAPEPAVPSLQIEVAIDGTVTFTGANVATDPEDDQLTIVLLVHQPQAGTATATLQDGTVSVTGVGLGVTSLAVSVSDGALAVTVYVPVTVTERPNRAPEAKTVVDPVQVIKGTSVGLTAYMVAQDPDGDALAITDISGLPASGTATAVLADGTVTVTGVARGSTTVVVAVSDGKANIHVSVPVEVGNTAPHLPLEIDVVMVAVGETAGVAASSLAVDPDGDWLTVTAILVPPDQACATGAVVDGAVEVLGVSVGQTKLTAQVSDGFEAIQVEVPITVTAGSGQGGDDPNRPPEERPAIPALVIQAGKTDSFVAGDIAQDPDGDQLTITRIASAPASGIATASLAAGKVTVTGKAAGTTQVNVTVSDGALTANVSVPITVTAAPTPPPTRKYAKFTLSADLNGTKRGEVLTIDQNGALAFHEPDAAVTKLTAKVVAASGLKGHSVYGPGDWNGDGKADILTVDTAGVMFLRKGDGKGGFAAGVQIGKGWGNFRIIPAGDLNGDKLNDMLAIDSAGLLWLYAGDGKGGFKPSRTQVGKGWGTFDCYAAGDLNRDGYSDILGVNSSGVLYAYFGKGTGSFQAGVQVGKGWGAFSLAAGGDLNADGLADIVGRNDTTGQLYYYESKGGGSFKGAKLIATGW
ncbi:MAG: tandem-95 repeat protein [Bifidobacteriaceae bacterium]|nr:tandem-95 repeat protein [Bifidobacteriaceae bacterium]